MDSQELVLRDHQTSVIDALRNGFSKGHRTQLLYAPTGFGKTEVAIALMKATRDKFKSAAIVMDRLVLVDQTSLRLSKYGLPHGVFQSEHWKNDKSQRLQVCSAQTMERRDDFPKVDLLIVDECHIARKQTIEFIKNNPDVKVIGLTATPFTKGLGSVYENVVTGSTNSWLVDNKWLTPLRVFVAKQIDMTGAKKVAGEWSQDIATERGMQLTGDIVEEWIKKTHEIFGKPEKTIVFCSGVAHGADLVSQFARKGYNFVSISYRDDDEFKRQAIEDFSKPDTLIHGLIATDILTRGFDVADVKIGVSARPFSKSFSSHVQQMGRVMRPHPTKEFAVWLDHSGNYLRFRDDWDALYQDGVTDLDKHVEKAKREPSDKEKNNSKCPNCGHLWPKSSDVCSFCGHVRRRMNKVETVAGKLEELQQGIRVREGENTVFYSELVGYAKMKGYNVAWAGHKYRDKYGVWPRDVHVYDVPIRPATLKWIKSRIIAYAKSRRAFGSIR
jgi:DNA repair protein RadD